MFLTGLVVSPLFDTLVANNTISITVARKISNSLASVLPAAALTCLAFLENFEPNLVNALLIVAVGTSAFQQSGYMLNTIDLTPNHAGTLFGLINGINNIFSLLAPLTVGLLGSDKVKFVQRNSDVFKAILVGPDFVEEGFSTFCWNLYSMRTFLCDFHFCGGPAVE